MNEFLLIFRRDFKTEEVQPSPEGLQKHLQDWQKWFAELGAQDRLSNPLRSWDRAGSVIGGDRKVTNGPFAEIKESIGGMVIINAKDYADAEDVAKNCPILNLNGTVEIRMSQIL